MPTPAHADALAALLTLARTLTHANMTIAVTQRTLGEVLPLRAEPPVVGLTHAPVWHWELPVAPRDAAQGLQRLPPEQWPSLLATGPRFQPEVVGYLDCSAWGQRVAGGLLFLWDAEQAEHAAGLLADQGMAPATVLDLRPLCAQLLDSREQALRTVESEAHFYDIFDSLPQGIVVVSEQGSKARVNRTASALLDIPAGLVAVDVLARAMRSVRGRCDNAAELERAYDPLLRALDSTVLVDWQLGDEVWRVDTHPILQDGRSGRVWLFQDVTAQIRLEQVLRREATHDALTGLFNRRAFFDRAQAHYQMPAVAAGPASSTDRHWALLMFDVDHFKQVNDRFGHPVGDLVLREVAQRAQGLLRDGDLLARYGGEEFIVLIGPTTQAQVRSAAERLRQAIAARPVLADKRSIEVRVSIGVTLRQHTRETLAQTLERADSHLYRAKREGRNRVVGDDDPPHVRC